MYKDVLTLVLLIFALVTVHIGDVCFVVATFLPCLKVVPLSIHHNGVNFFFELWKFLTSDLWSMKWHANYTCHENLYTKL